MNYINGFSSLQLTDGKIDTTISTHEKGIPVTAFLAEIPAYKYLESQCDGFQKDLAEMCDVLENIVFDYEYTKGQVGHGDRDKAYYETARNVLQKYRGES